MMNEAQRAALLALLERAQAGKEIRDEEVAGTLGEEEYARYLALRNRIDEDLESAFKAAAAQVRRPPAVEGYESSLNLAKEQGGFLLRRLTKLEAEIAPAVAEVARCREWLEENRPRLWRAFELLEADARAWVAPGSEEEGWPPRVYDKPTWSIALPGTLEPRNEALRRVVGELLGGS